jgi:hypothetical protein
MIATIDHSICVIPKSSWGRDPQNDPLISALSGNLLSGSNIWRLGSCSTSIGMVELCEDDDDADDDDNDDDKRRSSSLWYDIDIWHRTYDIWNVECKIRNIRDIYDMWYMI